MSLTDFTGKSTKDSLEDKEIFKYIPDKRILRVLFEIWIGDMLGKIEDQLELKKK